MSSYSFDITTNTITFDADTDQPQDSTFSSVLSEFDNDSRGTPRVADYDDLTSELNSETDYDNFISTLNLTRGTSRMWIGSSSVTFGDLYSPDTSQDPNPVNRYHYKQNLNGNILYRQFFLAVNYNSGGFLDDQYGTSKWINLFANDSTSTRKVLVYFPDNNTGSGGASGDPHVVTFGGARYTL